MNTQKSPRTANRYETWHIYARTETEINLVNKVVFE